MRHRSVTSVAVRAPTRRLRRAAAAVIGLLVVSTVPVGHSSADHTGEAAERAAREILDARERANAAAQAMFDAESRLDSLTIELADAEARLAELESEVATLRSGLADNAVRQFIGAGAESLPLFTSVANDTDRIAARVYVGAANGSGLIRADDYEAAIDELGDAQDDLERRRAEAEAARATFARLQEDAEAEVLELQQIEQERLQDEAVQHELEQQRQARLEQERQEQERQEQERQEQARRDQEAADAAQREADADRSEGTVQPPSGGGGDGSTGGDETSDSDAPADSGSSNDGDAGDDDAEDDDAEDQPAPTPAPVPVRSGPAAGSGMVCPVAGSHSFADTWGAPRSGGRRHQGVDMMAASGVPLVAVEAGAAYFKTNRLGGNAIWLTGSSGTKYYYAHLSSWEGSSRSVSQGEVIGYVGTTGNAGVAHLHFEVHPGGGAAVNPYPYVRAIC